MGRAGRPLDRGLRPDARPRRHHGRARPRPPQRPGVHRGPARLPRVARRRGHAAARGRHGSARRRPRPGRRPLRRLGRARAARGQPHRAGPRPRPGAGRRRAHPLRRHGDAGQGEGRLMLSHDEAAAAVTAPGERFEIDVIDVDGVPTKVFKHAPPSLREVFATARARERRDLPRLRGRALDLHRGDAPRRRARRPARRSLRRAARRSGGGRHAQLPRVGDQPSPPSRRSAPSRCRSTRGGPRTSSTTPSTTAAPPCSSPTSSACSGPRRRRTRLGCRILSVRADEVPDGVDRWEDVRDLDAPMPDVTVTPDMDATILYTSGTTGHPKGAVSTHRAVIHALMAFGCKAALDKLRRPDDAEPAGQPTFILIVPLFHVTGLRAGDAVVLRQRPEAGDDVQVGRRPRPRADRAGAGHQLRRRPDAELGPARVAALRRRPTPRASSASAAAARPAPPELVKRVASSFKAGKPSIGYGMTETNAYGPGHSGTDYVDHPTSTGRGTPVLDLAVRDPEGNDLPIGERGEIWFKGPHLIRGYWGKPEATAETIVDGWLRSGDLGRLDEEGFVYVEDRAKDMVLRAGENVYCAEVEAAIYEHPAVYEAAVFGVPHERLGEEVAGGDLPAGRHVAERRRAPSPRRRAPRRVQGAQPRADRRRAAPAQRGRQVPQARPARPAHRLSARQPIGEAGARRGGGGWPRRPRVAMTPRRAGSMALRPMAPSTSSSGWKATTVDAAPAQPAGLGVEQRAGPARASADRRQPRTATPPRHRRADDHEVEAPRRAARRRSSGWWTPPSRCASPSITTGAKNPGIAHDAATASATRGRRSPRPNTTRRPSDCRTAQIHSGSGGQASGSSAPIPSEIMSVLTVPSGSSAAASAVGRAAHGRRAARARVAARSAAGARLAGRPQRRRARDRSEPADAPAGPRPTAADPGPGRADRARADRPAATCPEIEPADVPTMIDACRGSHPVPSASAASTPAWKAPPATPPAPSTNPTRAPITTCRP